MNVLIRSSVMAMAAAVATITASPPGLADDVMDAWAGGSVRNALLPGAAESAFSNLSRSQLRELSALFTTTDGAGEQIAAAEAVIERDQRAARLSRPARTFPHAANAVADVARDLRAAGIDGVDPAALGLGTVQRLSQVFSKHDDESRAASAIAILEQPDRRAQLSRTVAEVPGAGERAAVVVSGMRRLGVTVADPGTLTMGQLARISAALGPGDGASDQRAAIKRILGM